ncbi:hypothetical protein ACTI_85240 [Actinoplanes sp. OR16]|uniref:hypothetical protein n=1 Tax=Actinoplanes sp. OR16 TaxID=946334 RepID=UPI000F711AC6|nr:hypothetical protein [Actinoplanes sp. OR16]BBH71839.1 hypothetical protein ACTI_85240 [Actinoplanes sp. OR16]
MTTKTVKVDRVRSAAEAASLEAHGADIIGVCIDPDPRFADDRTITVETAVEIRKALRGTPLALAMNLHADPADVLRVVAAVGVEWVQTITTAIPPHPVRLALRGAGIGIIYASIDISHDDDPSWVFSRYDAEPDINAAMFQVEVLTEYANSWAFLRDSSPEYEEEFQIEDLDELAQSRPVLTSLDVSPDNLDEILARLPHVRGLSMTLGEQPTRGDVRFHALPRILQVLEALQ